MEGVNFIEWFRKVFLPAVEDIRRSGPVVLLLEGGVNHTLLLVWWRKYKTKESSSTLSLHLLQPLDVGVFDPLVSSGLRF